MLCKKPYMQGVLAFGCGQCNPCRINRRRLWAHRMMLESLKHPASAFVTLTYDDDHLPEDRSLTPEHTQKWLKRIRRAVEPATLRFFLVGEYGDQTQRPHYHAAIFGLGGCHFYPGADRWSVFQRSKCSCDPCKIVRNTWGHGKTDTAHLSPDAAQYIAGYVTKKMTKKDDPRLGGRHPEFARQSNGGRTKKGGIGAPAVRDIVDVLTSEHGATLMERQGDVPLALNHGPKSLPLGRYLRQKIRGMYGFEEVSTPEEGLETFAQEMRELFKDKFQDPQNRNKSLQKLLVEENAQQILQVETRAKIYKKVGEL